MWGRSALIGVVAALTATAGVVHARVTAIDQPASTDRVALRTNPPFVPPGTDLERIAREMADLVNDERRTLGLPDLQWSDQLARAAADHAVDMAAREVLDHTGADGSDIGTRVTRAGYRWRLVGETIGSYYRTPESLVGDWVRSASHRPLLLSNDFYWFGGGVATDADGQPYWVLVLAL